MGLSASQARLLNLTARMHDIEYKAQNLEAQKLQMANESRHVYQEYENAMNKQKIQFKQIGADGSAQFVDASISTLLQAGYQIKILSGGTWYDFNNTSKTDTTNAANKWVPYKSVAVEKTVTALTADKDAGDITVVSNCKLAEPAPKGATKVMVYEQATANATEQNNLASIDLTSKEVLRNLVEAGFIIFEQPQRNGALVETNIATDTNLQEVVDPIELRKAEAKYESDMRRIDAKDKKFDTDLAALDNERNAIKAEMETLKTVAKENVERTFKLFS